MPQEVIIVEALSDKFKNKYSAGSVLAGGKWMQVSSKLNLSDFKKDSQMTVETKTNDKGYTSIVGIGASKETTEAVEEVIKETRPTKAKTEAPKPSYEDAKGRKILVQGVTQASLVCPALASLPGTTVEDIAENAKKLALIMIDFVNTESQK